MSRDNLEFKVRLQMVTDQWNAGIKSARANYVNFSSLFDKETGKVKASAEQAEHALYQMLNVRSSDKIKSEIKAIERAMADFKQTTNATSDELGRMTASAERKLNELNKELRGLETNQNKVARGTKTIGSGFNDLRGVIAGLGVGILAQDLAQTADQFKNIESRVKLATGEGAAFKTAFEGVVNVAQETYSSFEDTAELFYKINEAGKALGLTQEEVLGITRTINQAVQLSGGSAESAKAAIQQLIQGLQSGVLRGEEFNSIMEQAPRLATALADSLGVTTGELRAMAAEGALTSETVINAIQGQADALESEFATVPLTIGRSIENLTTSWTVFIGELDKGSGASAEVASAIQYLATNLDTVANVLLTLGKAAVAYKAINLALSLREKALAANQAALALRNETVAVTANTTALRANTVAANQTAIAQNNLSRSVAASSKNIGGLKGTLTNVGAASKGLGTGLLGIASKFGVYGAVVGSAIMLLANPIDKLMRKISGLEDAERKLEEQQKKSMERADSIKQSRESQAAATELAKQKLQGLSDASKLIIADFENMETEGKAAEEAIKNLKDSIDLTSTSGIKEAVSVLQNLQEQGVLTKEAIDEIFSQAIGGQDLIEFQNKAVSSFGSIGAEIVNTQVKIQRIEEKIQAAGGRWANAAKPYVAQLKEAQESLKLLDAENMRTSERMAMVQDKILNEAIRRTGVELSVLKDTISKTGQSAVNDIDIIVQQMEKLEKQGIDTSLALASSLSKGIKEANTIQDLDQVKTRIQELSSELGKEYTNGLLIDAKERAIELKTELAGIKPGVNDITEAFAEFGFKTKEQFSIIAERKKTAFDAMVKSGQATAHMLTEAFQSYAESAVAANGGVIDYSIKTKGALYGVKVEADETGKVIVSRMSDATNATANVKNATDYAASGYEQMGSAAMQASNEVVAASNRNVQALERETDAIQARDDALSAKRGAKVNSVDNMSGVKMKAYSVENIEDKLRGLERYQNENGEVDENKVKTMAKNIFDGFIDSQKGLAYWNPNFRMTNADYVDAQVTKLSGKGGKKGKTGGAKKKYVTENTASDSDFEKLNIRRFEEQKKQADEFLQSLRRVARSGDAAQDDIQEAYKKYEAMAEKLNKNINLDALKTQIGLNKHSKNLLATTDVYEQKRLAESLAGKRLSYGAGGFTVNAQEATPKTKETIDVNLNFDNKSINTNIPVSQKGDMMQFIEALKHSKSLSGM